MKRTRGVVTPSSPRQSPELSYDLSKAVIGTMNPDALGLPLLQKKNQNTPYNEIANLTMKADSLRRENEELQNELNELLNKKEKNAFIQFKKWEIDFQKRLAARDKELNEFAKYINQFRTTSNPTFVEVQASQAKSLAFDSISYTLLVSNNQRGFFSYDDLVQQNEELKELIAQQEETLKVLTARLNLFESVKSQNSVKLTIESLKRGNIPTPMQGAAPTRAVELKTKRKLLVGQLQGLIKQRKEILAPKLAAKMKKREELRKREAATKIQKIARGFLVRLEVKRMNEAAVKIQKVWRGLFVRVKEGKAMFPVRRPAFRTGRASLAGQAVTTGRKSSVSPGFREIPMATSQLTVAVGGLAPPRIPPTASYQGLVQVEDRPKSSTPTEECPKIEEPNTPGKCENADGENSQKTDKVQQSCDVMTEDDKSATKDDNDENRIENEIQNQSEVKDINEENKESGPSEQGEFEKEDENVE